MDLGDEVCLLDQSWPWEPHFPWNSRAFLESLPLTRFDQCKVSNPKWCRGLDPGCVFTGPESDRGHVPPAGFMSVPPAGLRSQRERPRKSPRCTAKAGRPVSRCLSARVSHSGRWHRTLAVLVCREAPAGSGTPWVLSSLPSGPSRDFGTVPGPHALGRGSRVSL